MRLFNKMDDTVKEAIEVTNIKITPEVSKITDEVAIGIEIKVHEDLGAVKWVFQWTMDTVKKRQIVIISEREEKEGYKAGHSEILEFKTPFVDVEEAGKLKGSKASNIGLLGVVVVDAKSEEEILRINMMTSIKKDEESGELTKSIINPFEG